MSTNNKVVIKKKSFTKTNMTSGNMAVYKKNDAESYYIIKNGKPTKMLQSIQVKKANGQAGKLSNLKKNWKKPKSPNSFITGIGSYVKLKLKLVSDGSRLYRSFSDGKTYKRNEYGGVTLVPVDAMVKSDDGLENNLSWFLPYISSGMYIVTAKTPSPPKAKTPPAKSVKKTILKNSQFIKTKVVHLASGNSPIYKKKDVDSFYIKNATGYKKISVKNAVKNSGGKVGPLSVFKLNNEYMKKTPSPPKAKTPSQNKTDLFGKKYVYVKTTSNGKKLYTTGNSPTHYFFFGPSSSYAYVHSKIGTPSPPKAKSPNSFTTANGTFIKLKLKVGYSGDRLYRQPGSIHIYRKTQGDNFQIVQGTELAISDDGVEHHIAWFKAYILNGSYDYASKPPSPPKAKTPSPPKAKTPSPPKASSPPQSFANSFHYIKLTLRLNSNNSSIYLKKESSTFYTINSDGKYTRILISVFVKTPDGKKGNLSTFKTLILGGAYKNNGNHQSQPKAKSPKAKSPNMTGPLITTLVPVIKPGPDHVKAAGSAYVDLIKKISDTIALAYKNANLNNKNNVNNYKNYVAKKGQMGFASASATIKMTYKFSHLTDWEASLNTPRLNYLKGEFAFSYSQYIMHQQLLFFYGRNVNTFSDIRIHDIIDVKWMVAQDKYIRNLSSRELLTVYGYSYHGDTWAHAYLEKRLNVPKFQKEINSYEFFPFYFQARDFYKLKSGVGTADTDYAAVIARVKSETDRNNIFSIINMWINELNLIIKKSPTVTQTFITFRGQKDEKYLDGAVDNIYTTERFCSTSVKGSVAIGFAAGNSYQRISILKGSKCLLMFGVTKFTNEFEVLIPRGSTYQVQKKRTNVTNVAGGANINTPATAGRTMKNLTDILLVGSPEIASTEKVVHN